MELRQTIESREEYLYVDVDNGNTIGLYDKTKFGERYLSYPKGDIKAIGRYIIAMRLKWYSGLFYLSGTSDDLQVAVTNLKSEFDAYVGKKLGFSIGYGRILFVEEPDDILVKKGL